tara:strand:- start:102 stop:383 length:282 start_codon:yes stop_codon:yes gene_type:complete
MIDAIEQDCTRVELTFSASKSLKFELHSVYTSMSGEKTEVRTRFVGKPATQQELWAVYPQCKQFALVVADFDKAERKPLSYFCGARHTLSAVD